MKWTANCVWQCTDVFSQRSLSRCIIGFCVFGSKLTDNVGWMMGMACMVHRNLCHLTSIKLHHIRDFQGCSRRFKMWFFYHYAAVGWASERASDWGPPGLSMCLPFVILPSTIKFRRSFFWRWLTGWYWKKGHKMVVVWCGGYPALDVVCCMVTLQWPSFLLHTASCISAVT